MAKLHLAVDELDATPTACDRLVGYVLTELEQDVTTDAERFAADNERCPDCVEAVDEADDERREGVPA